MTNVLNTIGLDPKDSEKLAEKLNLLLANYQIFYINTRGFHWNIRGEKFFELHAKFEELYTDLQEKIDEIAERIVTLGFTPKHNFKDYLDLATVQAETNVSAGREAVGHILKALREILINQRELLKLSEKANDEGTNALMSDYIREQEKLAWMYASFLNNN